jgi:hypothetical protein
MATRELTAKQRGDQHVGRCVWNMRLQNAAEASQDWRLLCFAVRVDARRKMPPWYKFRPWSEEVAWERWQHLVRPADGVLWHAERHKFTAQAGSFCVSIPVTQPDVRNVPDDPNSDEYTEAIDDVVQAILFRVRAACRLAKDIASRYDDFVAEW